MRLIPPARSWHSVRSSRHPSCSVCSRRSHPRRRSPAGQAGKRRIRTGLSIAVTLSIEEVKRLQSLFGCPIVLSRVGFVAHKILSCQFGEKEKTLYEKTDNMLCPYIQPQTAAPQAEITAARLIRANLLKYTGNTLIRKKIQKILLRRFGWINLKSPCSCSIIRFLFEVEYEW